MMYARILTREGIEKFQQYLDDVQEFPKKISPDLNEEPYSEERSLDIDVRIDENRTFDTKMEMAEYLHERFDKANLDMSEMIEQDRFWSWLAYVWFDELCPIEEDSRSLGQRARYICGKSYSAYSKHLIAFPYYVYSLHGKEKSKLFLEHPLDYVGNITEQIGSRKYIMTSDELIRVLHLLYWDEDEGIVSMAASRSGPGTFVRFGKVVEQLKLTYDLHDMDPEKIIDILPSEFDRWLEDG